MLIFLGSMVGLSLLNKIFFRGDSWSRSFFLGFLCTFLLITISMVVLSRPPENIEAARALLPGGLELIMLIIISSTSAIQTKSKASEGTKEEEEKEEKPSGLGVGIFQRFGKRLIVWTCILIILKAILMGIV